MSQPHASPQTVPQPQEPASAAANLFVARQPIFDIQREVTGYELLFRTSQDNRYQFDDPSQATRFTVNTSLNVVGLRQLVGERRAWVNVTRDLLVEGFCHVLPVDHAVIELLEDIEPDEAVVHACRELKAAGYQLALDDFVFTGDDRHAPLIALADVIKIDLMQTPVESSAAQLKRHARPNLRFLAEKVEDYEQFQAAKRAGYELFQGYFFCKPEVMQEQALTGSKQNYLLVLQEATQPTLDYDRLESRIKLEPALSVKLLRYINSAATGVRYEVTSIHHALTLLGERALRQWGALVALTCIGEDKPAELLRLCLQRARLCEQLGPALPGAEGQVDHFLMGLLAMLDGLLDQPLAKVLSALPLSEATRSALLGDSSKLGKLLLLCQTCERGQWTQAAMLARMLGIDEATLAEAQREARSWADRTLAAGVRDP